VSDARSSERGEVVLEPSAGVWPAMVALSWDRVRRDPSALTFRAALNLPTDRPVIASGHQATLWHPGILAKRMALAAAADSREMPAGRAGAAWVVVDQDDEDTGSIARPIRRADGVWIRKQHRWCGALPGIASGSRPACEPREVERTPPTRAPQDPATEADPWCASVDRALASLRRFAHESSLARQVTVATSALLAESFPQEREPTIVYASDLERTARFVELVERMAREPEACVRAYNAAVRAHPESGLRELIGDEVQDRWELPLWWLAPGKPRARVFAEDLQPVPNHTPPADGSHRRLAPRAILMTGLLRSAGCDLFIHGLGGGIYDKACEAWFAAWRPDDRLAPAAVVTATLRLPLATGPAPSPQEVTRTAWRARSARHNPRALDLDQARRDDARQREKQRLVDDIANLPRKSRCRREAYLRLLDWIEMYREANVAAIAAAAASAAQARAAFESRSVVNDRTWAFVLHEHETLARLRDVIAEKFGRG
jgi:hypothetical protein